MLVELVLVGEGVKGAADKLLFCAASCEGAFPGGAGLVNFYICHSSDLFGRGGGGRAQCASDGWGAVAACTGRTPAAAQGAAGP